MTYNTLFSTLQEHITTTNDPARRELLESLCEILHVEGFGGAEDFVNSREDADELIERKLDWLRDQRAEGLR